MNKSCQSKYLGRFQIVLPMLAVLLAGAAQAETAWPNIVESADGVPISYEVYGSGEPTLVFVHGWSCDARYWRAQVPHFAANHRVVVIDLAGHGHSGLEREEYTMAAFGADVEAVVEDLDAVQVILVGHSMGGRVTVAAAQRMPEKVLGIIGVDTFLDFSHEMREEFDALWALMKQDFREGARQFVPQMFIDATDAALRDWLVADMLAAPAEVAVSAMEQMLPDIISGNALSAITHLQIPVVAINADIWPTNIEANREHIDQFEAVIMEDTDHFLHMAIPEKFNRELEQVIASLTTTAD